MENNYLSGLNPPQQEAVRHINGPLMIIAGAGSGKTRVLTHRVAYLLQQGIDAFNILSLTFTNKAAKEMKERIMTNVGTRETKNLWMGTFHSIFARILRMEGERLGFPSNFTIYDTQDAQNVLKKVINDMQLDTDIYKPKQIFSRISSFKNNLITVKAYFNNPELIEADNIAMRPLFGEIYKQYVDRCFKNGAMDFDDLLLRTNELLTRFPEVLAKYQNRFKYIMVDEYQDTNHSQYLIVKALASKYENICVVGDDAQSIYGFRGANINNILNFKYDYPDTQIIALEQNYRSSQNIVNAANDVIANNIDQLEKKVWTQNDIGDKLPVYMAWTDADEANFVASNIFELKMQHQLNNDDFAILYRTNAQSRAMEEALRKKNIPYRVYGGLSFYQRKEIKDLVAYLRLVVNPKDEEALLRIINYPMRGIGATTVNKLIVAANELNVSIAELLNQIELQGQRYGFNLPTIQKLNDFWLMIKSFQVLNQSMDAFQLADHIAKTTGLIKVLKEDDTPEGISRIENINELINSLQGFIEEQQQLEDGNTDLAYFLENIALATDQDKEGDDIPKVSLMTVHLAKGLEFPYVYIVGLEEELFPSGMALNNRSDLEEERRLFYVAITRAEKKAILTYSKTRFRWGKINDNEPSRFIEEIDESRMEYLNQDKFEFKNNSGLNLNLFGDNFTKPNEKIIKEKHYPQNLKPLGQATVKNTPEGITIGLRVGDKVLHDRFGKGEIITLEGEPEDAKALINFETSGEKKLLLKFAKLRKIEI